MTTSIEPHEISAAIYRGESAAEVYGMLASALAGVVGYRVLTVLKLDVETLRSVRLYSSELTYPVGGTKQHQRGAWSACVIDRGEVFLAPNVSALRATFPDSAAIEATGCGSVIAVPILSPGSLLGTMNLWHFDEFYDRAKADRALPFAAAIAPLCERGL